MVVDSGAGEEDVGEAADDDNDVFDSRLGLHFGGLPLLFGNTDSVDVLSGRSRDVGLGVVDDTDEDDDDSRDDL